MRHMHRANAWRRLVPGHPDCVGVPRCRASLDFFESLTGSFRSSNHGPTGFVPRRTRSGLRRVKQGRPTKWCGPAIAGPPQRRRLAALLHARKRRRCLRSGADLHREQVPPAAHSTPRNSECAVLETRKAHSAFRPREAARCRHVSHAARIAMPSALQAGRPVCRVGMSPLSRPKEPTRRPCADPERLSTGLPFHENPVQRRSPEIGRGAASVPVPVIRFAGYPDHRSSQHSAENPTPPPAVPPTDCRRNPEDGICRQQTAVPNENQARSSPTRNPVRNAPAFHPKRSKCSAVGDATSAALEHLPDHDPRQQRGAGHSRSYSKTRITASQANRMPLHVPFVATGFPEQRHTAQAVPEEHPGLSAPKRNAHSRDRLRPRKLRVIRSPLRAIC